MHFPKIRLAQFGASFKESWQIRDWSRLVITVPRKYCSETPLLNSFNVVWQIHWKARMPFRACVFQHRSDYTHVHSKQITLSDTSALQLVNCKHTLPSHETIVSTWAFQVKSEDNVTPSTLAWVTRAISLLSITIRGIDATWLSLRQKHITISLVFVAFIRMSLFLDQSVIMSADSCSIYRHTTVITNVKYSAGRPMS